MGGTRFSQPAAPASAASSVGEEWPKIRILVLGDSGVGKTCLVERLVTGQIPPSAPRWTMGCNVQVMTHTVVDTKRQVERRIVVEFWDIGGHRNFCDSRQVYYHQINGVFLVHDWSNKKSFNNLRTWLQELEREDSQKRSRDGGVGVEEQRYGAAGRRYFASSSQSSASGAVPGDDTPRFKIADPPQHHLHQRLNNTNNNNNSHAAAAASSSVSPLNGLPVLVVGNKCDHYYAARGAGGGAPPPPPKMFTFDSVLTSAVAIPPASSGSDSAAFHPIIEQDRFNAFFHRVYDRRYG